MEYEFKNNVVKYRCLRCGHEWIPRWYDKEGKPIPPKTCPNKKCKSPYWNKERQLPWWKGRGYTVEERKPKK